MRGIAIRLIQVLLLLLGMTSDLYAQIQPVGTDLTIAIERRTLSADKTKTYRAEWTALCRTISKYFENRTGTIGRGPFTDVTCLDKATSLDAILNKKKVPSWVLLVSDTDTQSGFEIFYISKGKPISQASQLMAATDTFLADIKDPKYLKNICFYLLDQLPVFSLVTIKSDTASVVLDPQLDPELLPREYVLYTLRFDAKKKVWLPRPVGFARPPDNKSGAEWPVTLQRGAFIGADPVFAHNAKGRGMLKKTLLDNLGSFFSKFGLKSLLSGFLASLDSNLSGIRYGYPMLKSKDIISKSSMLSMFTEIRGGPLSGIRLYYDKTPLIKRTVGNGLPERFGWSCLTAGWSFNIPVPKTFSSTIHKFDFAPKIGIYDLDSLLVVTDTKGEQHTADFALKNAMDIGFETGVEHATKSMGLWRAWLAMNRSWNTKSTSGTRITSTKAGLDAYWSLFKLGKTRFKLLTFGSFEELNLTKDPSPPGATITKVVITDLSYNLIFLGAGATLAW